MCFCFYNILYKNQTFSKLIAYSVISSLTIQSRDLTFPLFSEWRIDKKVETLLVNVLTPIVKKHKLPVLMINGFVEEDIALNVAYNIFNTIVTQTEGYTILNLPLEDLYAHNELPKIDPIILERFMVKFKLANLTTILSDVINKMKTDGRLSNIVIGSYNRHTSNNNNINNDNK